MERRMDMATSPVVHMRPINPDTRSWWGRTFGEPWRPVMPLASSQAPNILDAISTENRLRNIPERRCAIRAAFFPPKPR